MIDFLSGETFRFFWLPLSTVFVTVLLKVVLKNDNDKWLTWNDCAVGPNLITTSIFILLSKASIIAIYSKADESKSSEKLVTLFVYLIFLVIGILTLSIIIKRCGWEQDKETDKWQLKRWWGIVFPNLIGILYLIIVYSFNTK